VHTFYFTYDDFLTHVEGTYNPNVNYLKFTSSTGHVYEAGTPIGSSFSFDVSTTENYEIVGFLGSVGEYIQTIGAYYKIVDACSFSACEEDVQRFNEECDYAECYNEICGWDWGDCSYPGCDCAVDLLFNGVCDEECNVDACAFDNSACKIDGCSLCENDEIGNGSCDLSCNIASCEFDGGDCWEGCDCSPSIIGNGSCNIECYYEAC
jgi:hypothetical protein